MKKIKFRLNFGGEEIRTMENLREHFSIEDALDAYHNGTLAQWLDVWGYPDELEQLKAIQATDARGILAELLRILGVASDPEEIEAGLSVVDYLEGRRRFWEDLKAGKLDVASQQKTSEKAINAYHEGYDALVQAILDHPNDLDYIYDRLDELATEYPNLLKLNAFDLLLCFYEKAPLAGLALLGDTKTRPHYGKYLDVLEDDHRKSYVPLKKLFDALRDDVSFSLSIERSLYRERVEICYDDCWDNIDEEGNIDFVIKPAGEKYILLDKPNGCDAKYFLREVASGDEIKITTCLAWYGDGISDIARFLILDGIKLSGPIDKMGLGVLYIDLMKAR